ncbi:hypothetical protein BDF19DRAFT_416582 [Syncephalis fuscata]|nr:hypothetical protein BDF19DRAFT_416582 [Syncephalis fuscata]
MNSDVVKSNEDITSNTSIPASIPLHKLTRSNNAMLKSSSTTNTNTTSDTSTLLGNSTMPWSIFIIFNLRNFSLNADLSQAIGIATAELTNISLSSRTIPGRISASSLRLGAAGLRSDGRIHSDLAVKEININLASLLCTLPTGPGSSYLLALHLDFAGLSAMVDYEYQRILLAELGAIRARAGDRWINFGLDDAQIELNCNIDLGHVEAIIATKTIPLIMRTADKISGLVQEKQSIVRTLFLDYETSGDNTTTTNRLSIAIPAPIPPTRTRSSTSMSQLVNDAFVTTDLQPKLALNINIGAVKAAVYPYYLSDSDCARAILQTFNLSLIRDVQSASDITKRDLQLKLDMLSLVKTQCRKMDGRDERDLPMSAWVTRVQEGTARNILSLPAATLSTQARRAADGLHTDLTFTTEFIGHVDIALNFGLIKYLQELGALYKRQMDQRDASADYPKKSVPSTPAATTSDESDPMAKAATVSTADTLSTADEAAKTATTATATATATNDNGGGATAKYPLANKMIYTVVEPVRFDPKLRVMGDATPPLEWIGVQRQRLPIILNEELADPLEKGMLQLQEVYSNAIALRKHGM